MSIDRFEMALPIPPWLRDHHFAGRAVLPLVEAIGLLARLIAEKFPEIDVTRLNNANFDKLLVLPEEDVLPIFIELERRDERQAYAALMTKKVGKISRLLHHAQMLFGGGIETAPGQSSKPPPPENGSAPSWAIIREKIYAELVPFGPSYRSLHGELYLQGDTASGTLIAPDLPLSCPALPHPFLLDGAMHAACVHGQSFCGFVPFPVGFAAMEVEKAGSLQQPGRVYHTHCRLLAAAKNELRYNVRVWGDGGIMNVAGSVMRDVSGGAIKPPAWMWKEKG